MFVHETVDKTSEWKPQTQHTLFAWCPVQLQGLYRFFFQTNLGPLKLINTEINISNYCEIVRLVVLSLLSRCEYFQNNGYNYKYHFREPQVAKVNTDEQSKRTRRSFSEFLFNFDQL